MQILPLPVSSHSTWSQTWSSVASIGPSRCWILSLLWCSRCLPVEVRIMLRGDIIQMAFTVLFSSKTVKILCALDLLCRRCSLLAALLAYSIKQVGIKFIVIAMFLYWPVVKGLCISIEKSTISHLKVFPNLHQSTKIFSNIVLITCYPVLAAFHIDSQGSCSKVC